jgi:hypothetical protein
MHNPPFAVDAGEQTMTAKADRRVQVLLTQEEANRFEQYCREHGHKKSTLLVRLLREFLDREGFPDQQNLFGADKSHGEPAKITART